MKKSPCIVYQKYCTEGSVLICAEAPPIYEPIVIGQLRAPGIMKLVPQFDFQQLVAALMNEGIPQDAARDIALSIKMIEDGAYCFPKEHSSKQIF